MGLRRRNVRGGTGARRRRGRVQRVAVDLVVAGVVREAMTGRSVQTARLAETGAPPLAPTRPGQATLLWQEAELRFFVTKQVLVRAAGTGRADRTAGGVTMRLGVVGDMAIRADKRHARMEVACDGHGAAPTTNSAARRRVRRFMGSSIYVLGLVESVGWYYDVLLFRFTSSSWCEPEGPWGSHRTP